MSYVSILLHNVSILPTCYHYINNAHTHCVSAQAPCQQAAGHCKDGQSNDSIPSWSHCLPKAEMLLMLQVEHKTLRWLAEQPDFKRNIVAGFKSYNQERMDRFSRK